MNNVIEHAPNVHMSYYERVGQYVKPRPIERFVPPEIERQPPKGISILERSLWYQVDSLDHDWRSQFLKDAPKHFLGYFCSRYKKLFESKGRRVANTYFRETLREKIIPRITLVNKKYKLAESDISSTFSKQFDALPAFSRKDVRDLAESIATYLYGEFCTHTQANDFELSSDHDVTAKTLNAYQYIAELTKKLQVTPPYQHVFNENELTEDEALSAIARMTAGDWWYRKLCRRRDMQREHQAIALGQVHSKASPYASKSCINEWEKQKEKNWEYVKSKALENEETGEQLELSGMVIKTNANPAIRRCELTIRMRGFDDLANELGYIGEFYTLTAPSKYHSVHSGGGFVDNWMGNDPRETQKYLCSVWARVRAKLKRENINIFGFRTVEPHHDGTPHWHLGLFMQPEHRERLREIFRYYALLEDSGESGALEHRFKYVAVDPGKGSMTAYMMKYISKNIDGYKLGGELDNETGRNLKDMSMNVTAWASRWRIRQFQQIGGAPVTVYRELRRLKGAPIYINEIDTVSVAADLGDWAAYTQAQGGPLVKRADLRVRISYEEKINQYAEQTKKIKGVFSPLVAASEIITRTINWLIVNKNTSASEANKSSVSEPWSTVNNCTRSPNDEHHKLREQIKIALKKRGLDTEIFFIDRLIRGSVVDFGGIRLRFSRNQLIDVFERTDRGYSYAGG